MGPKYSENALLKVAGMMASVIIAAIAGIAYCVRFVVKSIT